MTYQPIPGTPLPPVLTLPVLPSGPDSMINPEVPPLARTSRSKAELVFLILMGIGLALVLGTMVVSGGLLGIIAIGATSFVIGLVVLAYLWLDRYHPAPPQLLLLAFGWGATVSIGLGILVQLSIALLLRNNPSRDLVTAAVVAPISEELIKGAFLLIMLTGSRKLKMISLTDCLVYAGLVGAGFAFVEDIGYITGSGSDAPVVAALRLILTPFSHPLFTTMTAFGVYWSMRQPDRRAKFWRIASGFVGAILLHALWNGSTFVRPWGYPLVYVLIMMPALVISIVVAVKARKRDQLLVASKVPHLIAAGLITPEEGRWVWSVPARRATISWAAQVGLPTKALARFVDTVIELAFVRDRLESGRGTPDTFALQAEYAQTLGFLRSHTLGSPK